MTGQNHRALVEEARRVAEQSLAPRAARHDAEASFPSDNMADLHSAGLMALRVPEDLGGSGASVFTYVQVVAELAQACGSTALMYAMHSAATTMLSSAASTSERAREVLNKVVRDGAVISWAFSESGVGGNLLAPQVQTRAASAGRLSVSGTKSFCTGAGYTSFYLVNTGSGEAGSGRSQTLLVLDADHPGLEVDRTWDGMGMRANQANALRLELETDEASALGGLGGGMPHLTSGLATFVLGLSATSLGIARAAHGFAVGHVSQRVHTNTGHALSGYQDVRTSVGDSEAALHGASLALAEGARIADEASPGSPDLLRAANLAKLLTNTTAIQVAATSMDVCGGQGFSRHNPLERYYRDARSGALMGANVAVLRDLIGSAALGLETSAPSQ